MLGVLLQILGIPGGSCWEDVCAARRQNAPEWQKVLKGVPGLAGVSLKAEESAVFEELNLAWARHELISDGLEEVSAQ
jgi:hypothetical protein